MARTDNLTNFLTDIANSIRTKEGTEEQIAASEFDTRIANLPSGGASVPEKGIVINEWDESGHAVDVSVIGMTEIPGKYFYSSFSLNTDPNLLSMFSTMKRLQLPSSVTSIGTEAFRGCHNLVLTELPSSVTSIDTEAFSGCQSLVLTELPSSVTSIKSSVFENCIGLTSLDCQGKITYIDEYAFSGCRNLAELMLPNITDVPTLEDVSAFDETPISLYNSTVGYIYVPDNLVDSFKSADNWSTYADQIKPISSLNIQSIEISSQDMINLYNNNKPMNISVTYNGGKTSLYYPEQEGYTLSVSGNATLDGNILTLTDEIQAGDIITITVTSTYDNNIKSTKEIEVFYKEQNYTINLNDGQWIDSGTTADNDNIIYKSDAGSYNQNSGISTATITFTGYTNVKLYIRSYAEGTYDYTEAFAVDTPASRGKGLFTTKNNNSATNYVECIYELDGGTHTIEIMYSKDGGGNSNDDRGYFYIGECS